MEDAKQYDNERKWKSAYKSYVQFEKDSEKHDIALSNNPEELIHVRLMSYENFLVWLFAYLPTEEARLAQIEEWEMGYDAWLQNVEAKNDTLRKKWDKEGYDSHIYDTLDRYTQRWEMRILLN